MEDHRSKRYLLGLEANEEPQSPEGTEADPQRIVLRQYLQGVKSLSRTDYLIDVGSGNGVLAHEICKTWNGEDPPTYVAIDLPKYLDSLCIPTQVHNKSLKYYYKDFLSADIASYGEGSVTFVIRNVLHELDIEETSELIFKIASILTPQSEIYIQDMTNLPVAERGNVGWEEPDLKELLEFSGLRVHSLNVTGRSGTNWFALTAKKDEQTPAYANILQKCIEKRSAQKEDLLTRFSEAEHSEDPRAAHDLVRYSLEISVLEKQLGTARQLTQSEDLASKYYLRTTVLQIPLYTKVSEDIAVSGPSFEGLRNLIGLEGAIINKDQIDFPQLVHQSKFRYWSVGYSQRVMFATDAKTEMFRRVADRGVDMRLILSDPHGAVAQAVNYARGWRSGTGESLIDDIYFSIDRLTSFQIGLTESAKASFQARISQEPFSGSYFFIDNLCFFSLYTRVISGSKAPCLIFAKNSARLAGVFELLEEDFLSLWSTSPAVDEAKNASR